MRGGGMGSLRLSGREVMMREEPQNAQAGMPGRKREGSGRQAV